MTSHNSSCNAASTRVKERDRDSVREIKRQREREGKKPQPTHTNTHTHTQPGIFSMMRFDSATSTFRALLEIKPYRKTDRAKFK